MFSPERFGRFRGPAVGRPAGQSRLIIIRRRRRIGMILMIIIIIILIMIT